MEDRDVVVKVTGSTVCGSDLHLLHGTIDELQKGDILGHELCGILESTSPVVSGLNKGDRVVASFQIALRSVQLLQEEPVVAVREDEFEYACKRHVWRVHRGHV